MGGLGGGAPQEFFYVFINFIKKFYTNLRFQNLNYLLTIVVFHRVHLVQDPGIVAEGLALVDHGPDQCRNPEHDLCFVFQQPSALELVLASEKVFEMGI